MKIKNFLMAVLIAAASTAGFAAGATATFADGEAGISGKVEGAKNKVFTDTWNFFGLGAGTYTIQGALNGTNLSFTSIVLDGRTWDLTQAGNFSFASVEYSGHGPLQLTISGTKLNASPLKASYNGSVSVSPVPEPETYAMLLAGLGVMGAIARRRKQAA